jgi:hypothetical protein
MAQRDDTLCKVPPDRDGSSPQAAIPVESVLAEYAWLREHLPGFSLARQSLTEFEGMPLDALTVRAETGEEREIYFDISSFFGLERVRRSSATPCPYCGEALRAAKAKQCSTCGMDWRDPTNVIRRGRT